MTDGGGRHRARADVSDVPAPPGGEPAAAPRKAAFRPRPLPGKTGGRPSVGAIAEGAELLLLSLSLLLSGVCVVWSGGHPKDVFASGEASR